MKRARPGKAAKATGDSTSPSKKGKLDKDASKAGAVKKGQRKVAARRLYDFPEPMPVGEILEDMQKRQWKLGKSIGRGGFGELYLAEQISTAASEEAGYVVKIEPETNGPLFCEMNFYCRVAKAATIRKWCEEHRLYSIGVPCYVAHGNHKRGGKSYRFLVLPRFREDLEKLFIKCGRIFSSKTVCLLALTILDSLEYLHEHEYVHADIKGSNLLVGTLKDGHDQVYLVDYGLVSLYKVGGKHREYKEDPRKCHDGTIEFTSLDAHKGVAPSRRGDLEILAYVLLQWSCGKLPWEDNLLDKNYVKRCKQEFMDGLEKRLPSCFSKGNCPGELLDYFKYVKQLQYFENPNYNYMRSLFENALRRWGFHTDDLYEWNESSGRAGSSPLKVTKAAKQMKQRSESRGVAKKAVSPKRMKQGSDSRDDAKKAISPRSGMVAKSKVRGGKSRVRAVLARRM